MHMRRSRNHSAYRFAEVWADCGGMALTGRPESPNLGPPSRLVAGLELVGEILRERTIRLGRCVQVDACALLGERAALEGLSRRGDVSCGGQARMLRSADGWVAVNLARSDDVELVPAWLELDPSARSWDAIAQAVACSSSDRIVERGVMLGLPVAAVPTAPPSFPTADQGFAPLPVRTVRIEGPPAVSALAGAFVVDLSSLWAGPLCGSLLADAGARVVKVESTRRPDGARLGAPLLFDLMNSTKASVALDLSRDGGRAVLRRLIERADIVVEASRPRALEQMGLHARELVAAGGPSVWVSITGHGREEPGCSRVAFGDDAAVAGGLVVLDEHGPCFCADAVADPATGLVAATAVADAICVGGRWILDVSMAGVAASLAGPTLPVPGAIVARRPRARSSRGRAHALGADNPSVLDELVAR
jgi:hypothetical protein